MIPLTNAQIIDAYYAGQKSAEVAHKELAESGLTDKDIETLIHLSRKRFSESTMEYLVHKGFRNRDQLIQYYKDASYTQEDAEAMAERLLNKSKWAGIEDIVKEQEKLYKANITSEQELRAYYTDLNLDREEQDLAIAKLDLQNVGTRELTDSQIARLYQQGVYTYQQALNRLLPRYTFEQDAIDFLTLFPVKEEE